MNLILIHEAVTKKLVPYTSNTLYKKSSKGELPGILVKIGNKLHVDLDAWTAHTLKEQKRQAKIAKRKQAAKALKAEGV